MVGLAFSGLASLDPGGSVLRCTNNDVCFGGFSAVSCAGH